MIMIIIIMINEWMIFFNWHSYIKMLKCWSLLIKINLLDIKLCIIEETPLVEKRVDIREIISSFPFSFCMCALNTAKVVLYSTQDLIETSMYTEPSFLKRANVAYTRIRLLVCYRKLWWCIWWIGMQNSHLKVK